MVKQNITERRGSLRAKHVLSIQHRLISKDKNDEYVLWQLSTTQDISITGLKFLTEREYKVNDTLDLYVVMSGILEIFKGRAKVVRVERKKNVATGYVAVKYQTKHLKRPKKSTQNPSKKRLAKRI